ncbi:MAG: RNA polymerase sigma factor [Solirubrobacteraceae bacterium]
MTRSPSAADRRLFERLVQDTRDDLLGYTLRRSVSPEDAADVLSETYLIAWRKLKQIPPGDQARLWLFGVARNVLRQGANRRRIADALVQRLAREIRIADEIQPAAPATERTSGALRAALATLPERDREILTLTAWEGLTPTEIAAVLGAPANLVRVRLHRARARLARRLKSARSHAASAKTAVARPER